METQIQEEVVGFTYVWKAPESNQAEKIVEEILNESR
jgi:hypothetical protein